MNLLKALGASGGKAPVIGGGSLGTILAGSHFDTVNGSLQSPDVIGGVWVAGGYDTTITAVSQYGSFSNGVNLFSSGGDNNFVLDRTIDTSVPWGCEFFAACDGWLNNYLGSITLYGVNMQANNLNIIIDGLQAQLVESGTGLYSGALNTYQTKAHFCLSWNGSIFRFFINGNMVYSASRTSFFITRYIYLVASNGDYTGSINLFIDDFVMYRNPRIANFTVPTAPFTYP